MYFSDVVDFWDVHIYRGTMPHRVSEPDIRSLSQINEQALVCRIINQPSMLPHLKKQGFQPLLPTMERKNTLRATRRQEMPNRIEDS